MKFQLKGTELHKVLGKVIKGFNVKEDNSYVAFKLDPDENKLTVTARSRSTFFEGKINTHGVEVDDDEALIYHLDGTKLKQLVSILPSSPVNISFEINDKIRNFIIKTASDSFKLPVTSETPLEDAPEVKELVTVDANDYMKVMKDLIKIVSTDQATIEHQISCMHVKVGSDKIKLTATDSYALGSISVEASTISMENDESKDVLIRHTEVNTLMDSFDAGETLTIVGSDESFGYIDEGGTLSLINVIDMTPLDTSQVEALSKDDNVFTVDKGELKAAIEVVAKLSPNDAGVDIQMVEDSTDLLVSNHYGDTIKVKMSDNKFNSPGVASFDTGVLIKSITPANNGPIRLEFGPAEDGRNVGTVKIVSLNADGSVAEDTSLVATLMVS